MPKMIREIAAEEELEQSAAVVRYSFMTVAAEFTLTLENCPTHPAFTTAEKLRHMRDRGVKLFGLFDGDRQIGFVAVEKASDAVYYVERLAVLPEYRHAGMGRRLMDFAFDYVRQAGGEVISIGVIADNGILKRWYKSYGFRETSLKRFGNLPFTVCFMEKRVASS